MSKYIITDIDQFNRYNTIINSDKYWNPDQYRGQLNEGIISHVIGKPTGAILGMFLGEEIKRGKEISNNIQKSLGEIRDKCDEILASNPSRKVSEFTKHIQDIVKECEDKSFDTLALLSDTGVSFANYSASIVAAELINFGVLFYPITNIRLLYSGFDLYMSIIRGELMSKILMLEIAFVDFQVAIHDGITDGQSQLNRMAERVRKEAFDSIEELAKNSGNFSHRDADKFTKLFSELRKQQKQEEVGFYDRGGWSENIYKDLSNNLSNGMKQKNDEAISELKAFMTALGDKEDKDVSRFATLAQHAAVVQANKVCVKINANFIKLIEVFKLPNIKNIITAIKDAEQEQQNSREVAELSAAATKAQKEESAALEGAKDVFNKKIINGNVKDCSSFIDLSKEDKDNIIKYYNSPDMDDAIKSNSKYEFLKYVASDNRLRNMLDFVHKCLSKDDGLFEYEADNNSKNNRHKSSQVKDFKPNYNTSAIWKKLMGLGGDRSVKVISALKDFDPTFDISTTKNAVDLHKELTQISDDLRDSIKKTIERVDSQVGNKRNTY